jgi:PEP-CTERM motif-containing protein
MLMRTTTIRFFSIAAAAAILFATALARPAQSATELITNGGFETGSFAAWTDSNIAGGSGNWFLSTPGAIAPFSGIPTAPNGLGGAFYAVSDQTGPGTHSLTQPFTVPLGSISENLSFQMFVNDYDGGPFFGPLDHTGLPVEFGTVDILAAGASPFSTAPADIVKNVYLGADLPLGSNPHPYSSYAVDLTPFLTPGATYQVRFAESDNSGFFNMGFDNVSITSTVPEPAGLVLFGLGIVGSWRMFAGRRRTK